MIDPTQDGRGATPLGEDDRREEGEGDFVRFDEPSGTARVLATGRPFAVPDAATSPDIAPGRAAREGVASCLFVPLAWNDAVQRVLAVGWPERREISDADVELAQLAADQTAAGLARLEADARRAAGSVHDHAVVRSALALNTSLDLEDVLSTLAREASRAVGADCAVVFLGDAAHGAVAAAGHNIDCWEDMRVAPGQGAVGIALATGATFVTHDYQQDVDVPPDASNTVHAAVAVPMTWDDQLRGALSVSWNTRRRVRDEDLEALEALAGLATVACRNAEAYEHVQHIARTDALTGVLNHGAMQVRIR